MAVVANVAINVDASSAVRQLNAVDSATNNLQKNLKQTEGAVGKLTGAFRGLGGVLTSIAATAALKGITQAGIDATTTDVRIRQLTKSYNEYGKVQNAIAANARTFNLSQNDASRAFADIYARLRPVGVTLENIQKVYLGFNTAAAQSGLTAAQAAPAFTQLAQALGSGALRGDEFNSIAEQVPGILGAIAKVMGQPVGKLRELAAQGQITADVVIKALGNLAQSGQQDLAALAASPAGAVAKFQQAAENLQTTIGTKLLPAFTPFIQALTTLLNSFTLLPAPVQNVVAALAGLAIAFGAVAAPIGFIVQGLAGLAPAITAVMAVLPGIISMLTGAATGALSAVVALLTGPVGIVLAIGAAVTAAIVFRNEIGTAFQAVGKFAMGMLVSIQQVLSSLGTVLSEAAGVIYSTFAQPMADIFDNVGGFIRSTFQGVQDAITAPFKAAVGIVKGIMNGLLATVQDTINKVVQVINDMIRGANNVSSKVGIPAIPLLKKVELPQFAEGGYVEKSTNAIVGEAGPEYIIPASKMAEAMKRYGAGARGSSVIPDGISPQVNITTGPVTQIDGINYVTQADLMNATQFAAQMGISKVVKALASNPSLRRSAGLAR